MKTTAACPTPRRCGVSSHVVGTHAATLCRLSTRRPPTAAAPPPAPVGPHRDREVVLAERTTALETAMDAARAELAEADAAVGWDPASGLPHPTGGFTSRTVVAEPMSHSLPDPDAHRPDRFRVEHTLTTTSPSPRGVAHRTDGPASVVCDVASGAVVEEGWARHGHPHRTDGPAATYRDRGDDGSGPARFLFGLEDRQVPGTPEKNAARVAELLAAGCRRDQVVPWLVEEKERGRRATKALVAAGVDVEAARACWEAGVTDPGDVLATIAGQVPLSWAATGS